MKENSIIDSENGDYEHEKSNINHYSEGAAESVTISKTCKVISKSLSRVSASQ